MIDAKARVSLDQWRALIAVVDHGGYAQAAEALKRSQSSVSYQIQKLETQLDVQVFEIRGRKAELTDTGRMLARRARFLLHEAGDLEAAARRLASGWEAEIRLAVDHLFPQDRLFDALNAFSTAAPQIRITLLETLLSSNEDALFKGQADLVVTPVVPVGFLGEELLPLTFVAVAHHAHPLHQLQRELSYEDLRQHRQIVIRDPGDRPRDAGWLGAEQRWTVSHMSTSQQAVCLGLGYAWLPRHRVASALDSGLLKALPLREGGTRSGALHLVFADRDAAGPATLMMASELQRACGQP